MSTTLLFAEILIIGLHSGIWFLLLLLIIWGNNLLAIYEKYLISDSKLIIGLVLVSFFYVIGIVMDRFADALFDRWYLPLKNQVLPDRKISVQQMQFGLVKANPHYESHLYYARSRMRVARSSVINFSLITMLSIIYLLTRIPPSREIYSAVAAIAIVGTLITIATFIAWKKLTITFLNFLHNYDSEVNTPSKKTTDVEE